jgi:hypothetical protein
MTSLPEKKRKRLSGYIVSLIQRLTDQQTNRLVRLTIACERIDGREKVLQVLSVVRLVKSLQAFTVEGVVRSAGIESEVDAGLVQHPHSIVVVTSIVDGVNTDGVDSKLLKHLDVGLECFSVEKRILGIGSTTRLVRNTTDEETRVSSHEGVAVDSNLDRMSVWMQAEHRIDKSYGLKSATLALLHTSECTGHEGSRRNGGGKTRLHDVIWRGCQVCITNVMVKIWHKIRK